MENLTHDIHNVREKTAHFLHGIENDMRVMRRSALFRQFTASLDAGNDGNTSHLEDQIGSELAAFAAVKGIYYQIRVVGRNEDELVRVEAVDANDRHSHYRVVSESKPDARPEPFNARLVDHMADEHISIVPGELIDRRDQRIPLLSFVMPLRGTSGRIGALVVNVAAKNLFDVIEMRRHLEFNSQTILVGGDGHYLYHSERKKDWDKLLASREEDNLRHDYPPDIVQMIISGKTGTITEGSSEIISYAPLFETQDSLALADGEAAFLLQFFIFESVPKDVILSPIDSYIWIFSGSLAVFLTIAVGLGLLATQQFTKPIAALRDGASTIASGQYSHRICVKTHDEIEVLARQFNAMAEALESREKEIQQHRTKLEEMVELRTHELEEEKKKLQAILDHIPSAIMVLDRDLRIQAASSAFFSMTGSSLMDISRTPCAGIFPEGHLCHECASLRVLQTGNVASHIERIEGPLEGHRFYEHLAMPMNHDGTIGAVLEIITDVTERKRFERNLIQTEKLAAAGEMAAIIAHEFRNSLTSIKLILQLQREVRHVGQSDRQSLDVALGSIDRMEKIVAELLNFARPQPMEFSKWSLNEVVAQSVIFAKPHIEKHSIKTTEHYDQSLPSLSLDMPHLKESLINLLLNAVDAIRIAEDSRRRSDKGLLSIVTRRERTRKTLRDVSFTAGISTRGPHSGEVEITLSKGTECAVIEILDNGCGIANGDLRRIFDPSFTTKTNGTGLGLPMVKRTINAHGGIITASNRDGDGSTFRIYLPITERV